MFRLLIIDNIHALEIAQSTNWNQYGISSIQTTNSFQESLQMIVNFQPHIILADLQLENKINYELLDYLNSLGHYVNFIIMSNLTSVEYVRRSFLAGAKDFLLKPLSKDQLHYAILNIVTNYTQNNDTISSYIDTINNIDPILNIEYTNLSSLTNKILFIVKTHYQHNLDLTQLANTLQMNSKYIGRLFLKETHMKFSQYLKLYRMYMAKHLIEYTTETISSIAASCGYQYSRNFYLHFKEVYHLSPTVLRKEDSFKPNDLLIK